MCGLLALRDLGWLWDSQDTQKSWEAAQQLRLLNRPKTAKRELSGYRNNFDQAKVAAALTEVMGLCRDARLIAVLGTCWK